MAKLAVFQTAWKKASPTAVRSTKIILDSYAYM